MTFHASRAALIVSYFVLGRDHCGSGLQIFLAHTADLGWSGGISGNHPECVRRWSVFLDACVLPAWRKGAYPSQQSSACGMLLSGLSGSPFARFRGMSTDGDRDLLDESGRNFIIRWVSCTRSQINGDVRFQPSSEKRKVKISRKCLWSKV